MMSMSQTLGSVARPWHRKALRVAVVALCAASAGVVIGYLVGSGHWYLAVAFLLALPMFVVLQRYPMISVAVWLAVAPLVSVTESGSLRKLYWVVHRGLPLAILAIIALGAMAGVRTRKLPRLGWPEVLMGGYVVASLLSIAITSNAPVATAALFYDRVMVPMMLYLIVRLVEPDEGAFRWLLPVLVLLLLSQSLIGLVSWIAPGALPSAWLVHEGERTTGSLRDPSAFGTTILFAGLLILHTGLTSPRGLHRLLSILAFFLSLLMIFLTFSRANWLAGVVVVLGVLYAYRRSAAGIAAVVVPGAIVILASGLLSGQLQFAQQRLDSGETALSRLPPAVAAVRMFEVKPLTGWGYENFDRYSLTFQSRVGNLVVPEKDHASHNLFLTLIAEQGIVGLVLFIGPMVVWLIRTRRNRRNFPDTGFESRTLVIVLWLLVAAFVIVNNFAVMHISSSLGMWWLALGMIASLVHRYGSDPRSMQLEGEAGQLPAGRTSGKTS